MKVMHVITTLQTGGAEAMLASLVLSKRPEAPLTHVVSLVPGGEISNRLRCAGIPVTELGCTLGRPAVSPILRLARLIRIERPDVLQSWMYHADLVATLALALSGRWGETRFFWGVRCSDMDLRHYRWPLRVAIWMNARLSRFPNAVVANSSRGRDYHLRLGYRPKRFDVIGNGIDTTVFRPDAGSRTRVRLELGLDDNTALIGMMARVDPMKDHSCFLEALAHLPGVSAIIAGKGTQDLPERRGVYRLGERSDVSALLAACDLVVSSSAYGEGFPNAVAEGMSCGLPAVATDVGDSAYIVGDTGAVVEPKSPHELAAAVRRLLDESPEERATRGMRARRRIEELFSLSRAVRSFDALHANGHLTEAEPSRTTGRGASHKR